MNGQAKMQEQSGYVQSVKVPTGTEKRKFTIYKVTNRVNGKIYIGQTVRTLEIRKSKHLHGYKVNPLCCFHRAIRKHGPDAFIWETIYLCLSRAEADAKEREFIRFFGCKAPAGYNMTDGGEGNTGRSPSQEVRAKISQKLKGYKHSDEMKARLSKAKKGQRKSDETRAKMSASQMGKTHSDETRAKLSAVNMGHKPWNVGKPVSEEMKARISKALTGKPGTFLGRKHTPETREKISAAQRGRKGRPHSAESKEKMRIINLGKKLSEEHKAKISKTLKGFKHTKETRELMSKQRTGVKRSDEVKANIRAGWAARRQRIALAALVEQPSTCF